MADSHTPTSREVIELFEHILDVQGKALMPEEELEIRIVASCGGVDMLDKGEQQAHFHLTPELMELTRRVASVFGVTHERILLILLVHVVRDAAEGIDVEDGSLPEGVTLQ